jgi:ATP-dependent RNA helicase DDX19/DBP5
VVDAAAEALAGVAVSDEPAAAAAGDEPDPSLKAHALVDDGPGEIKTVVADNTMYTSAQTFEDLGLSPALLQGLYIEMKFERPSRIQAQTLPMILQPPHRSLIAQAHNGSGKTTCFTLAMLSRVDPSARAPQAICVCPTRELVVQNLSVLERMGKYSGITATSTASSESAPARRAKVEEQVVVGTHGRLRDWISKRLLDVRRVGILVFDEADEMLKVGAPRREGSAAEGGMVFVPCRPPCRQHASCMAPACNWAARHGAARWSAFGCCTRLSDAPLSPPLSPCCLTRSKTASPTTRCG